MNPFTSGVLLALFLPPLLYVCLRPLEHFDSNLRLPVTIFCLLQAISVVSKDNDMILWGATFLQLIVTGIIAGGFARRRRHQGDNISSLPSSSSLWIRAHVHYLKNLWTRLIICLHALDAAFIWNPQSPYTKNDYEMIGTAYNLIHLIMFITLAWRRRKQGTSSRAFYVYNFIVGLQPTRAIVRTITTCPFRPSDTIYWQIFLYFLSSALAAVDTLPALVLCFQGISSETELSSLYRVGEEQHEDVC